MLGSLCFFEGGGGRGFAFLGVRIEDCIKVCLIKGGDMQIELLNSTDFLRILRELCQNSNILVCMRIVRTAWVV